MANIITLAEFFIKKHLSGDFSDGHDFAHTMRVVRHSLKLCDKLPEADRNIVHLAAILHDVARPEESASKGQVDHAQIGADIAGEFLLQHNHPADKTARIVQCIREHRFRSGLRPSSLEAQILFDADKLDSLGAIGIARAFFFAAQNGAAVHNSREEALAAEPYSSGDTAFREFLVKLSGLPDAMLTRPGKDEALRLKSFMQSFFDQLNQEFFS